MTQRAVQELPVFGRDMSRLYFLVPGVQATGTSAPSEQPHDIFRPTIGGQYWGGISFQLDGTDNRDSVLGEPVITPNLDSVAELKITTTSYDAEFGQASQAIIASHTKSGTNTLHGSLFEYRRDQHGAARDPFAQAQPIVGTGGKFIPPTLWNQFGGSFGGPIQKDKTFYFGDYQANRQHNGASLLTRVPTAAERAGDLSGLNTPIFNPCNGSDCNIAPAARQQFAGNVIPTNLLSPQAQNLLKFIPLALAPTLMIFPADGPSFAEYTNCRTSACCLSSSANVLRADPLINLELLLRAVLVANVNVGLSHSVTDVSHGRIELACPRIFGDGLSILALV